MQNLIKITLSMISALESSGGRDLAHEPVRTPSSIHYGEAAIGDYGMMPKTLLELREPDPSRAAKKLATRILARNTANVRGYLAPSSPCPFITAVILWERGPRARITTHTWRKGNAPTRLKRARHVWSGPVRRSASWTGRTFD